jgi:endoglycosylceramidase
VVVIVVAIVVVIVIEGIHPMSRILPAAVSCRARRLCLAVLALWALAGAAQVRAAAPAASPFLRAEGPYIVDPQGRIVILRGLNTGNVGKDGVSVYGPVQKELQARNAAWGFNCMRLVFVWEGLEPVPGQYDEAYLKKIEDLVAICHDAGVWAVLDLHQDLFSRRYGGDGAPAWACQDKGLPMTQASYWGLNYLAAPVMACFDAFWADAPAPDGVGIQTHYIKAWQHVAQRFRDDPTVIGYDLMNEPYVGSDMAAVLAALFGWVGKTSGPGELAKWLAAIASPDPQAQFAELAAPLQDLRVLEGLFRDLEPPVQRFETGKQQPFYDRLVTAIRTVDANHLCFFEPVVLAGCAVTTALRPPRRPDGTPHANLVFAPHYYETSTEIGLPYEGNAERGRWLIKRGFDSGTRLGLPVWFGEWCSPSPAAFANPRFFRDQLDAFDSHLAGWAAWSWEVLLRDEALVHLTRPGLRAIAGTPLAATCKDGWLELQFRPEPAKGDTLVWFPPAATPDLDARLEGGRNLAWERDARGFVHLRPPENAGTCTLRFRVYAAETAPPPAK